MPFFSSTIAKGDLSSPIGVYILLSFIIITNILYLLIYHYIPYILLCPLFLVNNPGWRMHSISGVADAQYIRGGECTVYPGWRIHSISGVADAQYIRGGGCTVYPGWRMHSISGWRMHSISGMANAQYIRRQLLINDSRLGNFLNDFIYIIRFASTQRPNNHMRVLVVIRRFAIHAPRMCFFPNI